MLPNHPCILLNGLTSNPTEKASSHLASLFLLSFLITQMKVAGSLNKSTSGALVSFSPWLEDRLTLKGLMFHS